MCDDSCYGAIKDVLSEVHRNPAGASGGERNHKSAKHVHSRLRSRLGQAKVETGTAILFNAKQLHRQMAVTRDNRFCKWLKDLGMPGNQGINAANQLEELLEGNEGVNGPDEFDEIDLSGGIHTIADEELLFA